MSPSDGRPDKVIVTAHITDHLFRVVQPRKPGTVDFVADQLRMCDSSASPNFTPAAYPMRPMTKLPWHRFPTDHQAVAHFIAEHADVWQLRMLLHGCADYPQLRFFRRPAFSIRIYGRVNLVTECPGWHSWSRCHESPSGQNGNPSIDTLWPNSRPILS